MLWYHSFQSAREPMSSYTHFLGVLLSLIGLPRRYCSILSKAPAIPCTCLAALIFCCSTLALYTTSCVYPFSQGTPAHINHLRKLDHAMNHVLIAGSYTPRPMSFYPKGGPGVQPDRGSSPLWASASRCSGFCLGGCPLPSTCSWAGRSSFYLDPTPGFPPAPSSCWQPAVLSYTIGGVIYGLKKPDLFRTFGFHELFHCFVLLGSLLHYLVVAIYIL